MLGATVDHVVLRNIPRMSIQVPRRRRGPRAEPFSEAGIEPTLEDLLSDPLTAAVMRCDGVSPASLRALISSARSTLQTRAAAR